MSFTGKRVFITGGAGFIGSYLAEKLLQKGDEVFVLDDLSTGSIENVEHLEENPNFHLKIDTVMNKDCLIRFIDRVDHVYHLAAAVGAKYVVENPLKTLQTNIVGTENVLELANKKKKKVLIASSSEVYGKNDNVPFREDGDSTRGATSISRWGYAASKAIDEFLGLAYWREEKLPTVIVRLFNTVGPRQSSRYGMVIPTFVKQALSNQPITVYGTGEQTRCFAHVDDVTNALIALMNLDGEEALGNVFNVGNSEEVSMNELALRVKTLAASNSEIIKIPYEDTYHGSFEDMMKRLPDISKIKSLINFQLKFNLDAIVKDVVKYYREL